MEPRPLLLLQPLPGGWQQPRMQDGNEHRQEDEHGKGPLGEHAQAQAQAKQQRGASPPEPIRGQQQVHRQGQHGRHGEFQVKVA